MPPRRPAEGEGNRGKNYRSNGYPLFDRHKLESVSDRSFRSILGDVLRMISILLIYSLQSAGPSSSHTSSLQERISRGIQAA